MLESVISSKGVILIGMAVVFAALILLVVLLYLSGAVLGGRGKRNGERPVAATPGAGMPSVLPGIVPAPAFDADDEVVAVIAAVVATMLGGEFRISSIHERPAQRRATGSYSAWAQAGRLQNTAPF